MISVREKNQLDIGLRLMENGDRDLHEKYFGIMIFAETRREFRNCDYRDTIFELQFEGDTVLLLYCFPSARMRD